MYLLLVISFGELGVLLRCIYAVAGVFDLADQNGEAIFNRS